jgi:hypothetical protein
MGYAISIQYGFQNKRKRRYNMKKQILNKEQVLNNGLTPIKGKKYFVVYNESSLTSTLRYDFDCIYESIKTTKSIWVKK